MKYIEHIIEPTKLLLAWQSPDRTHRNRYIIGELNRHDEEITLSYLADTIDFQQAKEKGFEFYPAFRDIHATHQNVLDAFMRRLPPRTRGDFPQYLETLRIRPDAQLSNFALLGYSGAKLPSDGFSLIHPFNQVNDCCELLLEAAGYSHIQNSDENDIKIDTHVSFSKEENNPITHEKAVKININNMCIGYVNRGLKDTFWDWIDNNRILDAWVEKINGSPNSPAVYIFVKVGKLIK